MRSFRRTEQFRPGMKIAFDGDPAEVPPGWLAEDGTIYNIADYPRLGRLLGNRHGGDGVTTFAVPDSRERVEVGASATAGYTLGTKGGADTRATNNHTLTGSESPPHKHYAGSVDHTDGILMGYHTDTSKNGRAGGSADTKYPYTSTEGGGGAHNHGNVDVRQRYLAVTKIIKY